MAAVLGLVDTLVAGAVPLYGAFLFTKDAQVIKIMASITPVLCVSLRKFARD